MSTPNEPASFLALGDEARRRVRIAAGCGDCDAIAKVPGAGETFDSPAGRCQLMHNGLRIAEGCYHGAWMAELIRQLRGHHEPQEERAFHDLLGHLAPGGTMVELGSFWGYYSLWFHRAVAGATNYLIEADPNNLEVGRRNFALNGMAGHFHHYALGRAAAPPAPFECESDLVTRAVPTISVDEFARANGLRSIDLLLSDIQGAETEMLEGAGRSIERGVIRFLVLSTHHHSISKDPLTHQKCLRFLRDRGARVLAEHSVMESYSGDGLIVAALRPSDRHLPEIAVSRNHPANNLFRETEEDLAEAWGRLHATRAQLVAAQGELAEARHALATIRGHVVMRALRFLRHPVRSVKRRLFPAA